MELSAKWRCNRKLTPDEAGNVVMGASGAGRPMGVGRQLSRMAEAAELASDMAGHSSSS